MTAVSISIFILIIFSLTQSAKTGHKVRDGPTMISQTTNQNFFTNLFSEILYQLLPRNIQSSNDVNPGEMRYLIQKRREKIRFQHKFKDDILSIIAIKRNDQEDDIQYKPPKINYQRKGSKSQALKKLFEIAGVSHTEPGIVGEEKEEGEKFVCPSPDGYFPAWNCRNYHHCYNGVSRKMTCSKDLGWNIQNQSCDWIRKLPRCQRK